MSASFEEIGRLINVALRDRNYEKARAFVQDRIMKYPEIGHRYRLFSDIWCDSFDLI